MKSERKEWGDMSGWKQALLLKKTRCVFFEKKHMAHEMANNRTVRPHYLTAVITQRHDWLWNEVWNVITEYN